MSLRKQEEKRKQGTGAKNAAIAVLTDLLKPEEQKCYILLNLKNNTMAVLSSRASNYGIYA